MCLTKMHCISFLFFSLYIFVGAYSDNQVHLMFIIYLTVVYNSLVYECSLT